METGANNLFTVEQLRILAVSTLSPVAAFLIPTKWFLLSLVVAFAFNIWCGMRADGVSVVRCKNFSMGKFKNAVFELLLYALIIEVIFSAMAIMGDKESAIIVIKTLTYVFDYVYVQNAFKNLIIAYPKNKAIRIVYHVIRFEFKRATPSHVQKIIDRIENEIDKEKKNESID